MTYSDLKKEWMLKNTVVISMRLSKSTDREIIDHLSKQKSRQGYIKQLIKKDMENLKKGVDNL